MLSDIGPDSHTLAKETGGNSDYIGDHRRGWVRGLITDVQRHVIMADPPTFDECVTKAQAAEDGEGRTSRLVMQVLQHFPRRFDARQGQYSWFMA